MDSYYTRRVAEGTERPMTAFCPRCATPRAGDFRFCRTCGLDLDASIPSSTLSPAPESLAYETIELTDRDSGEMPIVANTVTTILGAPGYIRWSLRATP